MTEAAWSARAPRVKRKMCMLEGLVRAIMLLQRGVKKVLAAFLGKFIVISIDFGSSYKQFVMTGFETMFSSAASSPYRKCHPSFLYYWKPWLADLRMETSRKWTQRTYRVHACGIRTRLRVHVTTQRYFRFRSAHVSFRLSLY